MGILNKLQIKNKLFLSNDKRFVCGGALSTAVEPSNRLQHSDTEFQRFPQRTLSPISLIMSIKIRKRVGSLENLPERSTSLPGASSQCGTLHLNGCTSFCSAIPHHILCFPEEPVRCPFLKIFCPMGQLLVGACLPQNLLETSMANWNLLLLCKTNYYAYCHQDCCNSQCHIIMQNKAEYS